MTIALRIVGWVVSLFTPLRVWVLAALTLAVYCGATYV